MGQMLNDNCATNNFITDYSGGMVCVDRKIVDERCETTVRGNGTAFNKHWSLDNLRKELKKLGINEFSEVMMYNGRTGRPQKVLTFMGPCYYQKLKHMVVQKIHARSRGGRTPLTRQPKEGRKVGGGFRVGSMERDCHKRGTPILTSEGVCVKIETLTSFSEVYGWDSKKNGIVVDKQTNFAYKGKRMCYRITLKDGRVIDATKNHPFLTAENDWCELKNLRVSNDSLQVSVSGPLVSMEDDMRDCNGWTLDTGNYHFKTNNMKEYLKTVAFARVLGWVVTDSHIPKRSKIEMSLGHSLDVDWVMRDLKTLGITDVKQNMTKNVYRVYIPTDLSDDIRNIPRVITGAKVDRQACLPMFITEDCPKAIVREFLGAYFGADGHTCCLHWRGKRVDITPVKLSEVKTVEWVPSLIEKMKNIQRLLEKCGVTGSTIHSPTDVKSKSQKNIKNQEVVLNISIEDLPSFTEKIGMRYCTHKLVRLEAGASYRRFRANCLRQRHKIIERTKEIMKKHSLQIQPSLDKAILDIEKEEPILHDLVIPTYSCTARVLNGTIKSVYSTGRLLGVGEYFEEIDALKFFSGKNSNLTTYGVHRDSEAISTFNLKVIDVRPIGKHDVYDITVDKTHSFVANGVVSHNCLLANGCPAFVRDRLMEQSDEYKMYFCKICGLPALVVKGDPENGIPPSKQCTVCQSNKVAKVRLPYATKLLMYEFMGMNIVFRVLTDKFEGEPKFEAVELGPKITRKIEAVVRPIIEEVEQAYRDSIPVDDEDDEDNLEDYEERPEKPKPKPKRRKRKMNRK